MVNRKRDATRGSGYEKRVMRWNEARGFLMHRANRAAFFIGPGKMMSRRVDLWGAFDLAGIHATEKVRLIQVGTLANRYTKRKAIENRLSGHYTAGGHYEAFLWSWGRNKEGHYGFLVEQYDEVIRWLKPTFVPSSEAK
jgi:hypothetical protein